MTTAYALPTTMRQVIVQNPGGPDALRLTEGPLPTLQPDEVLVRVQAAGVNRPDILQREGRYPPPPNASPLLGLEVAGTVVACGPAVRRYTVGDAVTALTNGGGYAEYAAAPASQCLPWPVGYDAVRAAALPENYYTVWANLMVHGRLTGGESVLVHGGTSGIGVTTIQLARAFGATVYATAGSDVKCAACRDLGAQGAFNYRTTAFADAVLEATDGAGVDVVIDMIGAAYFAENVKCLRRDGRLVVVATQSGAIVPDVNLLTVMQKRLVITGSTMRPRSTLEKGALADALLQHVWPLLDAGRCGPVVHATFPLDEVAEAHRLLESSVHIGKVMLRVAA
jgi:NADPH:quinone reductase